MNEPKQIKIGIIGSHGLLDLDIIDNLSVIKRNNRFGSPSGKMVIGQIANVDCVLLARHEKTHAIMPTNVNYRANMWALYKQGCTHVITVNPVGSLTEEIKIGDMVFPDQFVDMTTSRPTTFYDGGPNSLKGVCHIPMDTPYCPDTRQILIDVTKELKYDLHETATVLSVEGPRFFGKAECNMVKSWGCDIIGQTTVPSVCLANELGLCFATLAMVSDSDITISSEVCVADITDKVTENIYKEVEILQNAIPVIAEKEWSSILENRSKIAKDAVISG